MRLAQQVTRLLAMMAILVRAAILHMAMIRLSLYPTLSQTHGVVTEGTAEPAAQILLSQLGIQCLQRLPQQGRLRLLGFIQLQLHRKIPLTGAKCDSMFCPRTRPDIFLLDIRL